MALQIEMETPSGHRCSYWRLAALQQDHVSRSGRLVMVGYLDQQAREDGRLPLGEATVIVEAYLGHEATTAAAYGYLVTEQRLLEEACEHHDETTGERWTQPARYEPGLFYGAENC